MSRKPIDWEWVLLKAKAAGTPAVQVARDLKVSRAAVSQACRAHKIELPRATPGPKPAALRRICPQPERTV